MTQLFSMHEEKRTPNLTARGSVPKEPSQPSSNAQNRTVQLFGEVFKLHGSKLGKLYLYQL